MADTDFGIDIMCEGDLDPGFRLVSGVRAVAQTVVNGLRTAANELRYSPSWGYSLPQLIGAEMDVASLHRVAQAAEDQARRDERVSYVAAKAYVSGESIRIEMAVELLDGQTFTAVLGIDQVTVEILSLTVQPR